MIDRWHEGKTLNEAAIRRVLADARREGRRLVRGKWYGATDDRADRWYWQEMDEEIALRGPGYASRSEAIMAEYRVEQMRDPGVRDRIVARPVIDHGPSWGVSCCDEAGTVQPETSPGRENPPRPSSNSKRGF